jgi:hypothetical protein
MQQHPLAGLPQIIYNQIFMQLAHVNYCNMLLVLSAYSSRLVQSHENLHYIMQVSTTMTLVFINDWRMWVVQTVWTPATEDPINANWDEI